LEHSVDVVGINVANKANRTARSVEDDMAI